MNSVSHRLLGAMRKIASVTTDFVGLQQTSLNLFPHKLTLYPNSHLHGIRAVFLGLTGAITALPSRY